MATKEDIHEIIALDGGIVNCVSQHPKIGWKFAEPSEEEVEYYNQNSSIDYWNKFLILKYAGTSCFRLNTGLREERWVGADEFCQLYKLLLNECLDEIEPYDNKSVWRWLNIPNEAFELLKGYIGQKIMVPQFFSTSDFRNDGYNTFFEIETCENSNGRYIADIVKKEEGEVLFKSNTVFEVISSKNDTIYMKEVKSGEYDLALYSNFWNKDIPLSVHQKLKT